MIFAGLGHLALPYLTADAQEGAATLAWDPMGQPCLPYIPAYCKVIPEPSADLKSDVLMTRHKALLHESRHSTARCCNYCTELQWLLLNWVTWESTILALPLSLEAQLSANSMKFVQLCRRFLAASYWLLVTRRGSSVFSTLIRQCQAHFLSFVLMHNGWLIRMLFLTCNGLRYVFSHYNEYWFKGQSSAELVH